MQDIQSLFLKVQEINAEMRSLRKEYKDTLAHDSEYQRISEEAKSAREQKKRVETHAKEQMGKRYERLEELQGELADLKQMMSDIAMTTLIKGKPVEVSDENDILYEPQFSVTFKKTNVRKTEKK